MARAISDLFSKVDVMDEDSVIAGLAKARAAHGQERVLVQCAMANREGKTVGRNRETRELMRFRSRIMPSPRRAFWFRPTAPH